MTPLNNLCRVNWTTIKSCFDTKNTTKFYKIFLLALCSVITQHILYNFSDMNQYNYYKREKQQVMLYERRNELYYKYLH